MTRESKFRGWDEENKCWRYGWLTQLVEGIRRYMAIVSDIDGELTRFYIHDEKTIGQFTGLKDKNGKDIYEGDILDFTDDEKNRFYVEFHDASFYKIWSNDPSMSLLEYIGDSKIIGNVHENHELIAAKDGGVKLD